MERISSLLFTYNWRQKLLAIFLAIVAWILVNNSITATKVFPNVAVRVFNLPADKTIEGIQPNGILKRHITLTLTGSKDVLEHLESSDLEVGLDAANKGDEWIARIGKKNIVALNPDVDVATDISTVSNNDFVVKLSRLVSSKIPVTITKPVGEPPKGYLFLDVWPEQLFHTVTGSEEEVEELRTKGVHLAFDLKKISAIELDNLHGIRGAADEVSYDVPDRWKRIFIPFLSDESQEINDPNAANLRIHFLHRELLPIDRMLPIRIFYPFKFTTKINPASYTLMTNSIVTEENGVKSLAMPLFSDHVSRLFLDVTRDNIEIVLIPVVETGELHWSIQFVDSPELENEYVRRLLAKRVDGAPDDLKGDSEEYLRNRFRDYMQEFKLYTEQDQPLQLKCVLNGHEVTVVNASEAKEAVKQPIQ